MTNKYEIKKHDTDEVIGKPPGWLTKWGTVIIFSVVAVLVTFACFIKYPDTIVGKITLTSPNPPANLVAPVNGKIAKIFVRDNQLVKPDDYLALIENSASFGDVMQLKRLVENGFDADSFFYTRKKENEVISLLKNDRVQLGDLQSFFNNYQAAKERFDFFVKDKSQFKKIKTLTGQLADYEKMNKQLDRGTDVLRNKLDIAEKKLAHDQQLVDEKVLAQQDLENTKKILYDSQMEYNTNLTKITQNSLAASEVRKKIEELQEETNFKQNDNYIELEKAMNQLKSEFYKWEHTYLIKSPIEGKVSFFKFWSENQFVQANEPVMAVVPEGLEIIGKAYVSVQSSGKIQQGQMVKIKLDNYPYIEFGMVNGVVNKISNIPQNNLYAIDVTLPGGLKTTYGKELPVNQELQGQAEIIVEDMRLIQRIFYQFKNITQNQ